MKESKKEYITDTKNDTGDIRIPSTEGSYENNIMRKPYVNKFDSLDERLKFLEECNVLNQTQEETENLNSPISNK